MRPYSWEDWGITPAEYEMLCQAYEQGVLSKRQIEDRRLWFKWGVEGVSDFIEQLDWRHAFHTDIAPMRDSITQREFEDICLDVLEQFPQVEAYRFEPSEFHFSFPSHSGRSTNGGAVYFDDGGRITGRGWQYENNYGTNLPGQIGERVATKIRSALYA